LDPARNLKRALMNVNNHEDEGQETVQEMFAVKLKPLKPLGPSLGNWAGGARKARKKSVKLSEQ